MYLYFILGYYDFFSFFFFFSSRRRHTRSYGDWSSDVCSSDLLDALCLNHRQARGIHVQESPRGVQLLHAIRVTVDDRAEPFLAVVAIGNIRGESDDAYHIALRTHEGFHAGGERSTMNDRFVGHGFPAERGAVRCDGGSGVI